MVLLPGWMAVCIGLSLIFDSLRSRILLARMEPSLLIHAASILMAFGVIALTGGLLLIGAMAVALVEHGVWW